MKKPKITVKKDIFVSAVVIARSDSKLLAEYVTKLFGILDVAYTNYEIVLVDNGLDDHELDQVTQLLNTLPCIRIIKLSQQFKYDTAVFAGLEVAIGDYICTLDATIDPPQSLPIFVERNKEADVVQGVSEVPVKGVMGSGVGRRIFYWYNRKYLGIDIPLNATYFASYTRRAINSLTASSRSHRYIRHLARRVGYGYSTQSYIPLQNPSNQRRLRTGVVEALEIVTSYSTHPLRFVTWLGFIASIINVLYAFYVLILNLFSKNLAPGWTSTSMQLSLMFFVLFIIMIILSEYIGRILTETHHEPNYFVADELVSTVALADTDKKNITR